MQKLNNNIAVCHAANSLSYFNWQEKKSVISFNLEISSKAHKYVAYVT